MPNSDHLHFLSFHCSSPCTSAWQWCPDSYCSTPRWSWRSTVWVATIASPTLWTCSTMSSTFSAVCWSFLPRRSRTTNAGRRETKLWWQFFIFILRIRCHVKFYCLFKKVQFANSLCHLIGSAFEINKIRKPSPQEVQIDSFVVVVGVLSKIFRKLNQMG